MTREKEIEGDVCLVAYNFHKTPSDLTEQPFASVLIRENHGDIKAIDGHYMVMEVGAIAKCQGKPVFADVLFHPETKEVLRPRVEVADGIYCQVKVILPKLPKREHPDGKTCAECQLWSREKGIEELNQITAVYDDGRNLKMNREVADQMAINYGKPMVTDENVGYCPRNSSLTCDTSPACEEGFLQK